jgi:hypothetical protein
MKKIIFSFLFLVGLMTSLPLFAAGGNASSVKLTIYGVWLSANGDCSDSVEILNSTTGTEIDIMDSPTIADHAITADVYKCLIIKMNDVVKFKPETTSGHCTAGVEVSLDTCKTTGSTASSKNPFTGATITCSNSTDLATGDQLFLYVSRNAFCPDSITTGCDDPSTPPNAFLPPVEADDHLHGVTLQDNITISADTIGNFIFNTNGKVGDDGSDCNMEPPVFGYRAD